MSDWTLTKLGNVADLKNGYAFKSKDFFHTGIPVIKIKNIVPPNVTLDEVVYYNGELSNNLSKYIVSKGDILISMTGSTVNQMSSAVGKIGRYNKNIIALLNQRVGKIEVSDKRKADIDYLYYFISRPEIQYALALNATGSANQANISPDQIKDIDILMPLIDEQKRISDILSSLDDKIELNLEMNKTLEEMAMAIYKEWFVDFGPFQDGEYVDSELGPIPREWEIKRLKDFTIITMGQSPSSRYYNKIREGLPFHQGVKDYGWRFPMNNSFSTDGNRIAEKGDILFSVRAPVGRINIAGNRLILGRGLAGINHIDNYNNFLFYSLKTIFTKDDIIGDGTVYKAVNKNDVEGIRILMPDSEALRRFIGVIEPMDLLIESNTTEIQALQNAREYLLPKLISGDIRVKEAEDTVKQVI